MPTRLSAARRMLNAATPVVCAFVAAACGNSPTTMADSPTPTGAQRLAVPRPNGPLWMVTGRGTQIFGGGATVLRYDVAAGRAVSPHIDAPAAQLWSVTGLAAAPNGSAVVLSVGSGEFPPRSLMLVDGDGRHLRHLTSGDPYWDVDPTWLPNGKSLVFSSNRCCASANYSGSYRIYEVSRNGGTPRRLTDGPAQDIAGNDGVPAVSRDGTLIAFLRRDSSGVTSLWRMDSDGSHQRRLITFTGRFPTTLAWSWRNGLTDVYVADAGLNGATPRIARIDISLATPVLETVYRCSAVCGIVGGIAASPDGKSIAITQVDHDALNTVLVVDLSTRRARRLTGVPPTGVCCLAWQPAPQAAGK